MPILAVPGVPGHRSAVRSAERACAEWARAEPRLDGRRDAQMAAGDTAHVPAALRARSAWLPETTVTNSGTFEQLTILGPAAAQ